MIPALACVWLGWKNLALLSDLQLKSSKSAVASLKRSYYMPVYPTEQCSHIKHTTGNAPDLHATVGQCCFETDTLTWLSTNVVSSEKYYLYPEDGGSMFLWKVDTRCHKPEDHDMIFVTAKTSSSRNLQFKNQLGRLSKLSSWKAC
jgi:hypothetical protein